MFKYYTDGVILRATADYDVPSIKGIKRNKVFMNEDLDYKLVLLVLKQGKIYRHKVTFNDDSTISVKTKLVYSF
jgi:hypothetical protein